MLSRNFLAGREYKFQAEVVDGVAALAEALKSMKTLETLLLRDNVLGPQCAAALALALPHIPTLRTLDIAGTNTQGFRV